MMSDSVILKNNISDERRMISVTWEVSASSHHQMLQCFMSQECFCPCGASATQHKSPCCCRLCIVLSSLTFLEERGKHNLTPALWVGPGAARCRVPLVLGLCSPLGNWVEGWEEMGSQ